MASASRRMVAPVLFVLLLVVASGSAFSSSIIIAYRIALLVF
jgi:hypothetical protein